MAASPALEIASDAVVPGFPFEDAFVDAPSEAFEFVLVAVLSAELSAGSCGACPAASSSASQLLPVA